jgi:uncharacterized protein
MSFGVETRPGDKVSRIVELTIGKEKVGCPLFVIHGKKDGPTLAITAGVHGTEYASIEAALRLGRTLDPQEIQGKVVIFPITNMPSFKKRTIYVGPHDGKNLNRVFPGKEEGTFSETLAHRVFHELIKKGDTYIDLHGGDMNEALVPFVIYAPSGDANVDQSSVSMAESFGIDLIVKSEIAGSAIYAASHAGIPAILAEAGGQGIWSEATASLHVAGVKRVMGQLGMMGGKPDRHPARVFPFPWLYSEHDGVFYPQVGIGDKVSKGQKVGSVCDFFGKELQSATSPTNGTILFLVTSLAINKGDPLMGIGG